MALRSLTQEDIEYAEAHSRWALVEGDVRHDETIVETFATKKEALQVRDELNGWTAGESDQTLRYNVCQLTPPVSVVATKDVEETNSGRS